MSVCEVGVPYWAPMITKSESNQIEACLKTALNIIFQDEYISFKNALKKANMESLRTRRYKLCHTFALKTYNNPRFSHWFSKEDTRIPSYETITLKRKNKLKSLDYRKKRLQMSAIPFLTQCINWHPPLQFKNYLN